MKKVDIFKPTEKQLRFIEKIEDELGIHFMGVTKNDARKWISNNVDDYKASISNNDHYSYVASQENCHKRDLLLKYFDKMKEKGVHEFLFGPQIEMERECATIRNKLNELGFSTSSIDEVLNYKSYRRTSIGKYNDKRHQRKNIRFTDPCICTWDDGMAWERMESY